jgi:hypothetical protein
MSGTVHNASTLRKAHMICVLRSAGMTWDEIGNRMDLSTARCMQIHRQVVPLAIQVVIAAGYNVERGIECQR